MTESIEKAHKIIADSLSELANKNITGNDDKVQLAEHHSKALLKAFNITTTDPVLTQTVDEALKAADEIGFPVVLKIVSPTIIHKSDTGGVAVNIKNRETLEKSFNNILNTIKTTNPQAEITGILVEKMAAQSTEIIIGAMRDAQFGPTVMFGLGGIFVEVVKDVSFRLAPVTADEALEMIKEIKAYPVLTGFRGSKPLDISAIAKTIQTVSQIITSLNQIIEIDLNPALVYPEGIIVVDARIIVDRKYKLISEVCTGI